MATNTLLLNALYDGGNPIGEVLSYAFALFVTVEVVYVFLKYVITSNK